MVRGLILSAIAALSFLPCATAAQQRPDIILIVTDDQPAHMMRFMPRTQELVGRKGVRFRRAFASTPLCCPARASLLTGLYSHNHGVLTNGGPFGGAHVFADTATLATWLQGAGYRTGLFGKYLNGHDRSYIPPGWGEWYEGVHYYNYTLIENGTPVRYDSTGSDSYSVNVLARKVTDFIYATPPEQNLFAYFTPYAPHAACIPGRTLCEAIAPQPDVADATTYDTLPSYRTANYNEADVSDKPAWVRKLPPLTAERSDSIDAAYRNMAESLVAVDRAVASIIDALTKTGRIENAVIIFTSDNGLSLGSHRWVKKACVYDECAKLPLFVRAPGIRPHVNHRLVEQIDIPATILEAAGIPRPEGMNGRSLYRIMRNPRAGWRPEVLIESLGSLGAEARYSAIRTNQYMYAEYENGDLELYDLKADPYQLENKVLDPNYLTVLLDLRERLEALRAE